MWEKFTILFAGVAGALLLRFIITMGMSGVRVNAMLSLENSDSGKTVTVTALGAPQQLDMEQFLVQVLAAQISPDREREALKCQAVIARTMVKKAMEAVSVADSISLGIEYMTEEECKEQWGQKRYDKYRKRLEQAVIDTYGQTLQYDGAYIDAMYHCASMGNTISALEAYGKEIPYLQQAACSRDVETPEYMQVEFFTWEQMTAVLNTLDAQGQLAGFSLEQTEALPLTERLSVTAATEHGYVQTVSVGGVAVNGDIFAQAAGLQSHVYYIEVVEEQYRIICLGKGHGIGLSQYSANVMAAQGQSYEQILEYFYPGSVLVK